MRSGAAGRRDRVHEEALLQFDESPFHAEEGQSVVSWRSVSGTHLDLKGTTVKNSSCEEKKKGIHALFESRKIYNVYFFKCPLIIRGIHTALPGESSQFHLQKSIQRVCITYSASHTNNIFSPNFYNPFGRSTDLDSAVLDEKDLPCADLIVSKVQYEGYGNSNKKCEQEYQPPAPAHERMADR
jgi:hypothetical protein